jgi:cardiolipin synthase
MARPDVPSRVLEWTDRPTAARLLAAQAFTRAAGAPLVAGNAVRLLRDGAQNYPAWLEAIAGARRSIHMDTYFIHADAVGDRFAEALVAKAAEGVRVRLVYDWVGALSGGRRRLWRRLRAGGVEVRAFNVPRLGRPLGLLARDHRKCVVVDGQRAFVSGLCVGQAWEGWPERGIPGWRDTGVEIRGPAVADVARAFAETWAACGDPLPEEDGHPPALEEEGDVALRVVATTSGTSGLFRLDSVVAALARRTLWLTDAYYAGTPSYLQALRAAARDGVDVRLLVPGSGNDIAVMQAVSRAGYRPLLDGGVRVFEWNGPMLHAKTAVADAQWARVGSSNLNLASWIGNWELDVVVENEAFGSAMEAMYLEDLSNATEIVLEQRRRVRPAGDVARAARRRVAGATTRAAAGALRIGHSLGSAFTSRRLHGPAERRLMVKGGLVLALTAALAFAWPRLVAWPLGAVCLWLALSLLLGGRRR